VPIAAPRRLGRYLLYKELASGGMAVVYLARLFGPAGFARAVAIKRLHSHLAKDPEFVAMFLDEARIAARIRHPNVVPTEDVVAERGELFIVMEFVHGASLSRILRAHRERGDGRVPPPIAAAIAVGMLAGLHAAHEATAEDMQPLGVVHRDVSPPNVLIGVDGVARTVDFGIAKALGRAQVTREGQVKGKLPYMAPEQLKSEDVDRRVDVWAAAVVLWEMLAGRKLFDGDEAAVVFQVLADPIAAPTHGGPEPNPALDEVVLRGLSRDREDRYPTALAMLEAIERACPVASARQLSVWMEELVGGELNERRLDVAELETSETDAPPLTVRGEPAKGSQRVQAREGRVPVWLWAGLSACGVGAGAALLVVPALKTCAGASAGAAPSASAPSATAPSATAPSATAPSANAPSVNAPAGPASGAARDAVPTTSTSATASPIALPSPNRSARPPPAASPTIPRGGGI